MFHYIKEFGIAVLAHWRFLLLSSSLGLILLISSLVTVPKWVSFSLVGLAILIACFLAWLDERKARESSLKELQINLPKIYALAKIIGAGKHLRCLPSVQNMSHLDEDAARQLRKSIFESWHADAAAEVYHQISEDAHETFILSKNDIPEIDTLQESWMDERTSRLFKLANGLLPKQEITSKNGSQRLDLIT